jgi:flagellar protein FlbD
MIEVTRLDGSVYYLNPHQIETIESRPDTAITLLSGKRLVVKDPLPVLLERIKVYRRSLGILKNEE